MFVSCLCQFCKSLGGLTSSVRMSTEVPSSHHLPASSVPGPHSTSQSVSGSWPSHLDLPESTANWLKLFSWTPSSRGYRRLKGKGKEEYLYSAFLHQGTYKALRRGSHSFTCKQHHACLSFVAFTRCRHHSNWGSRHPIAAHYSFIDPERKNGWVGLEPSLAPFNIGLAAAYCQALNGQARSTVAQMATFVCQATWWWR